MLDVNKDFLESFAKLPKEEQEKQIAKMPLYMIDVLVQNGYEIYIHNGAPVIEKTAQETTR